MKSNDTSAATAALVELQRTNPELLVLIAEDVEALYGKLGTPQIAVDQIAAAQRSAPTSLGLSRLVDASLKVEGRVQAIAHLKRELTAQPSAREATRLLELESAEHDGEASETMLGIAQLLHRATDKIPGFHCTHCGFRAPRYYWKCPGCNEWESFCATPLGHDN